MKKLSCEKRKKHHHSKIESSDKLTINLWPFYLALSTEMSNFCDGKSKRCKKVKYVERKTKKCLLTILIFEEFLWKKTNNPALAGSERRNESAETDFYRGW